MPLDAARDRSHYARSSIMTLVADLGAYRRERLRPGSRAGLSGPRPSTAADPP